MPRHLSKAALLASALLVACPGPPTDDGGTDAAGPDAALASVCVGADECDDLAYCNGTETCAPGAPGADSYGCVQGGSPCLPDQACDERDERCTTVCVVETDADADGAIAVECGGDDCDDADARRRPGNLEVCDEDDVDEDCDGATFGARDLDGDLAVDAACCNGTGALLRCGTDCNDSSRLERPGGTEVCDGRDQDCDAMVDEGTTTSLPVDEDRDLHGDETATADACPGAVGTSSDDDDCGDDDPTVHAAGVEIRDARDNDCDDEIDEDVRDVTWYRDLDGDGFGSAASGVTRSDAPVAGHSILATDCDDARADVSPRASEACNGRDDDCNGLADFPVAAGDYEDDDRDGHTDARCPMGDDCADRDSSVRPGAIELCDDRDNDCDARTDEDVAEAAWLLDRDGDGFGDDESPPALTCEIVPGRVLLAGDCDDDDASIAPVARDDCSRAGVDDDCDDRLDESGALVASFRDADLDGHGAGPSSLSCAIVAGRSEAGDDCDDARAARSPEHVEACTGGVDEDCDALADCEDPGCGPDLECVTSFDLAISSGDLQTARAVEEVAAPVVVCVSAAGAPVAGRTIQARPSEGVGVIPASGVTGADGCLSVRVRLSRMPGEDTVAFVSPRAATVTARFTTTSVAARIVHAIANVARASGAPTVGAASLTRLVSPSDVEVAASGEVYVADAGARVVLRISAAGAVSVLAGTGLSSGALGDGGPAGVARLLEPVALALAGGRLLVADRGDHRVREIDLATGIIDTFAGTGSPSGDRAAGVPGHAFALASPRGVSIAGDGTVWIGDDAGAQPFSPLSVSLTGAIPGTCGSTGRCAIAAGDGGALFWTRSSTPVGACQASDGLAWEVVRGSGAHVSGCASDGSGTPVLVADLELDSAGNLLVADADGSIVGVDRSTARPVPVAGGATPGEYVAAAAAAIAPVAIASSPGALVIVDGAAIRLATGLDRATSDPLVLRATAGTSLSGLVTAPIAIPLEVVDGTGAGLAGVAFEIDAGSLGRWSGGITDASGAASPIVRTWIDPRARSVDVVVRDLHDVVLDRLTATITTSAPPAGTLLTLAGTGTVAALDIVATMSSLVAPIFSAPAQVFLLDDGTLVLPGARVAPDGRARESVPPATSWITVDRSGVLYTVAGAGLRRYAPSGAPTLLPEYRGGATGLLVTQDGSRLFSGLSELDPTTGATISTFACVYPLGVCAVEPATGQIFRTSAFNPGPLMGESGAVLVTGWRGSPYVEGAAPIDVPIHYEWSLLATGEPGVLLYGAGSRFSAPCSAFVVRLEFSDPALVDGNGTSHLLAGTGTDTSDLASGASACIETPEIVGVDAAGHVYFVEASSPTRLRMIW